jgi:hypothetical protein
MREGEICHEKFETEVEFHLAEIKVDAILSYPWLLEHEIGVFPHLRALAIANPFTLLYGEEPQIFHIHGIQKRRKNRGSQENRWGNRRQVWKVGLQQPPQTGRSKSEGASYASSGSETASYGSSEEPGGYLTRLTPPGSPKSQARPGGYLTRLTPPGFPKTSAKGKNTILSAETKKTQKNKITKEVNMTHHKPTHEKNTEGTDN